MIGSRLRFLNPLMRQFAEYWYNWMRVKGEKVCPFSPGLVDAHSIESRFFGAAQGGEDSTGGIIQGAQRQNARVHVATDRDTYILELNRQPFSRCGIPAQKQL